MTILNKDNFERQLQNTEKMIIVDFYAEWCGPCKSELPHFQAAFKAYGDEIQFLMVALTGGGNDTKASADTIVSGGGYTFPVFYDDDNSAAYAYSIRSMPTSCFIDAEGHLVAKKIGAMNAEQLESYIKQIKPE